MKSRDFVRRYLFTAHQRCTEAPSHADHHTKLVFNPLQSMIIFTSVTDNSSTTPVHPLTFEDTPECTLPAPPVSGSPCNRWHNLYITKEIMLFRISGVTFEAPNFKFSGPRRGPCWGSLQRSPRPPSWWEGPRCPSPRTPSPPSALRASGFGLFGPKLCPL